MKTDVEYELELLDKLSNVLFQKTVTNYADAKLQQNGMARWTVDDDLAYTLTALLSYTKKHTHPACLIRRKFRSQFKLKVLQRQRRVSETERERVSRLVRRP